jgi:antagonist of KipI
MKANVLRPGFLTTVQDLGRPGFRQSGITPGGAADAWAMRVANLLVGNEESDAGLEVTLGGLRIKFRDERCVAWCGGDFAVRINDAPLPAGHACFVRAGSELSFGHPNPGGRAWLAISGGIKVPLVLGSRSTDLRGKFGGFHGRALHENDLLPLSGNSLRSKELIDGLRDTRVASWCAPSEWALPGSRSHGSWRLRVVRGADWMRFSTESIESFVSEPFMISPDSDRMGVRLNGPLLRDSGEAGKFVSEAVAAGTIQVPAGGQPILLLPDCQTIGGYPMLAHVITIDLSLAAQLRPGDQTFFCEVSLAEAQRLLLQREQDLARFRVGLSLHG